MYRGNSNWLRTFYVTLALLGLTACGTYNYGTDVGGDSGGTIRLALVGDTLEGALESGLLDMASVQGRTLVIDEYRGEKDSYASPSSSRWIVWEEEPGSAVERLMVRDIQTGEEREITRWIDEGNTLITEPATTNTHIAWVHYLDEDEPTERYELYVHDFATGATTLVHTHANEKFGLKTNGPISPGSTVATATRRSTTTTWPRPRSRASPRQYRTSQDLNTTVITLSGRTIEEPRHRSSPTP